MISLIRFGQPSNGYAAFTPHLLLGFHPLDRNLARSCYAAHRGGRQHAADGDRA
jgi:hypothetical protein